MSLFDEILKDSWFDVVVDRIIENSSETLSPRQKSELGYFMGEVARHLDGREEEAVEYLKRCWCFYSEANPAWLALAECELQAYCGGNLDASPEQRHRSFKTLSECLQSKTPESSKLAFKLLAYDDKRGHMVRI